MMPYTNEQLPFTGTLGLTVATSYEAAEKMAGKAGTETVMCKEHGRWCGR